MAITWADLQLWKKIKAKDLLPVNPSMIEIGEANWYGDVPPGDVMESPPTNAFTIAERYWSQTVNPRVRHAIDLHGTPKAFRIDLNYPHRIADGMYDLLVNTGTLEHVFDQWSAWHNCHTLTRPGGLMVHNLPWVGWQHHGLYNYQPGFVFDLASANRYTVELLAYSSIKPRWFVIPEDDQTADLPLCDVMIHAVFRKHLDFTHFKSPMQGCYDR